MRTLAGALVVAHGAACSALAKPEPPPREILIENVAELPIAPGNIAASPDGRIFVSLHQFYSPAMTVGEVRDGKLIGFANDAGLDTVLGIHTDSRGVVWMLDNAMRGGGKKQLVGWNATLDSLDRAIDLTSVAPADAFLNDFALDRAGEAVYIADPASGHNAALIVVDLIDGSVRRVLEGERSVRPEDIDLVIDGKPVQILRADGTPQRPRVGINPIALDDRDEWLYYGPMHGRTLYRVRTADLRNRELTTSQLASRVQAYAGRPICDGISIDEAGNIYLGDLAANAIGVIDTGRNYRQLVRRPELSWVDSFSFAPDGYYYVVTNQLHRSAPLNAGQNVARPPFLIARFHPLAKGRVGR